MAKFRAEIAPLRPETGRYDNTDEADMFPVCWYNWIWWICYITLSIIITIWERLCLIMLKYDKSDVELHISRQDMHLFLMII